MKTATINKAYEAARDLYAEYGVNTDEALETLAKISISLHCWQGDDVGGFERPDAELSGGGIMATGNYPGKARTPAELRQDLEKVFNLVPGPLRVNLHAIYGEFGGKAVDRDQITPEHFKGWVDWAKANRVKLDFNGSYFSHPMADTGYTLSSRDEKIRRFWIEHTHRCREISAFMGRELGDACIHNLWIPDGSKDIPYDRYTPRAILRQALDEIYSIRYNPAEMKDAVESKLFGIGSESYVVGSHEFYMGYAFTRGVMICLDLGHFHPTESVADKLSAVLQFSDEVLLHVSRGVRWDSDHVVILNDDIRTLANEIVASGKIGNIHIGLDFFDASINRVAAWTIGARAMQKGLLSALLRPSAMLADMEAKDDKTGRLGLIDETVAMPFGAVWNYYCMKNEAPAGVDWLDEVRTYEKKVLFSRA